MPMYNVRFYNALVVQRATNLVFKTAHRVIIHSHVFIEFVRAFILDVRVVRKQT